MEPERLRKSEWLVRPVSIEAAKPVVIRCHYARGVPNTAVAVHGLFRVGRDLFDNDCLGVAWWLPPTEPAGRATNPAAPQGVLSLSRLVVAEGVPGNAASFLLARSRGLLNRERWPALVTYADEWRGHTGAIYRADNWDYAGRTAPEAVYVRDGRMVARKAGKKTRTHAEMLELGAELVGRFAKHKFVRLGGR